MNCFPNTCSIRTNQSCCWNRINGYLNWLEPPTLRAAKCRCSTECIFVNRREERGAFKRRILADYKFALAMENAVVKDYVSEKVFDAASSDATKASNTMKP